jgi:hypothetical protein
VAKDRAYIQRTIAVQRCLDVAARLVIETIVGRRVTGSTRLSM